MKQSLLVLILVFSLVTPIAFGDLVQIQSLEDLVLVNSTLTLENGYYQVSGDMRLIGNSSLTIINANVLFLEKDDAEYSISGNSKLTVINSTIGGEEEYLRILAKGQAEIQLKNTELYSTYNRSGRTFFGTGIGLSENPRIRADDSKIGYVRLVEYAICNLTDTHIGNFGTQSRNVVQLKNCVLEQVFLVYENSRVQINQTLTGNHEWFAQSQLVKTGQIP